MARKDFSLIDGGSVVLIRPHTKAAREWVDANIGDDNGFQPYWPTVVCEQRYAENIVNGFLCDGLTLA